MCISVIKPPADIHKNPTCFMDLDDVRVEKMAKELKKLLALCCKSVVKCDRFMHVWNYGMVAMITSLTTINTRSTAQGGGGSFKNRKPIGEVGCCESGMAERSH